VKLVVQFLKRCAGGNRKADNDETGEEKGEKRQGNGNGKETSRGEK